MTMYEWENDIARDSDAVIQAYCRRPDAYPWGMFSGGTFVLDSSRTFQWYRSPHEMLTWMEKAEPVLYRCDFEEASTISPRVKLALSMLEENNNVLSESIMSAAAEPLSKYRKLEWWGNFDELASGGTEFALELRGDFRYSTSKDEDESGRTTPISESERSDFIEFLETYGV